MEKNRVKIQNDVLLWAVDYSQLSLEVFQRKFSRFNEWLEGSAFPTLNQLKEFANLTRVPIGVLFQSEPPNIEPARTYFRRIADDGCIQTDVSAVLRDVVFAMDEIREWMSELRQEDAENRLSFIGSLTVNNSIEEFVTMAVDILQVQRPPSNVSSIYNYYRSALENIGIIVMKNSVLGSNNHIKLNIAEFRGFSLIDDYAPVIFVNSNDAMAGQIFTLVHEFMHLLLGHNNLFSGDNDDKCVSTREENLCNEAASIFLMPPETALPRNRAEVSLELLASIAQRHYTSRLALAVRWHRAGFADSSFVDEVREITDDDIRKRDLQKKMGSTKGGGDFYKTVLSRLSPAFAKSVILNAREGSLLYRDAHALLGYRGKTFDKIASSLLGE